MRKTHVFGVVAFVLLLGASIGWPYLPLLWRSLTSTPQAGWDTPLDAAGFKLWRSGVPSPQELDFYWLGNDKVLFSGVPRELISNKRYIGVADARLHVWQPGTEPKVILETQWRPEDGGGGFCADSRGVFYSIKDANGAAKWFAFSNNRSQHLASPAINRQPGYLRGGDNPSCMAAQYADPRMTGRIWQSDTSNRYYLDFGEISLKYPPPSHDVLLIDSLLWKTTNIKLKTDEIKQTHVKYFLGSGRFVIPSNYSGNIQEAEAVWKKSNCYAIGLLDPEADKLSKHCIPYGEWSHLVGSRDILDTKAGLFFYVHSSKSALYYLNNGRPFMVYEGWVVDAKVSPNGCRVAFISSPPGAKLFEKYRNSVHVLDVCSAKE